MSTLFTREKHFPAVALIQDERRFAANAPDVISRPCVTIRPCETFRPCVTNWTGESILLCETHWTGENILSCVSILPGGGRARRPDLPRSVRIRR